MLGMALVAMVAVHQKYSCLVVICQNLPVVEIRLCSRLGSLVYCFLLVVEGSGIRWCLCQLISSRERASLHRCVLVSGRCLEFIESCVSRIGDYRYRLLLLYVVLIYILHNSPL